MRNKGTPELFPITRRTARLDDLTGRRFGRLIVIELAGKTKKGSLYWRCRCDCGNVILSSRTNLLEGNTQSCKCMRKEKATKHGESHTSEYSVWKTMIHRCTNPKFSAYAKYGAKGITVCERWRVYENFLADMGRRPSSEYSLDRTNNDLGYSPENCRWATKIEQARNKHNNIIITYEGKTMALRDWATHLNLPLSILANRVGRGWSPSKAFTQPVRHVPANLRSKGSQCR